MDSHLIGSLDTSVDPEYQSEPQHTSDRDTDTDDDVSISCTAGTRIVDCPLRVRDIVGCGQGKGSIDLRGQLTSNTRLVVQRGPGRLDIGVECLEVLRWNVGEPLSEKCGDITVP